MLSQLSDPIQAACGSRPVEARPLTGGSIGQVYLVRLANGERLVAKVDDRPEPALDVEGYMLDYLASHSELPVPAVRLASPSLLLMSPIAGESHFSGRAQEHAAELLAGLHAISAQSHGLERDTLIGGLHQPNRPTGSWLDFFRQQRLLFMAEEALRVGRLPTTIFSRVERFAAHLERWVEEPERPALLHGDVWRTNVLARGDRITAFLDPAIYYGHPEIELAFITLFGTFARPFFERYQEMRPIAPGFFEVRRDLYNLYPLLVHVRLFGGGYVASVDNTLRRFGY
jgi:fructosamine-3-kinase